MGPRFGLRAIEDFQEEKRSELKLEGLSQSKDVGNAEQNMQSLRAEIKQSFWGQ